MTLLLPVLPAGFSGSLEFSVVPPVGGTDASFQVIPFIGAPLLNPNPDPKAATQFAQGAQAYALANLGVTIPNSQLPILSQYAVNQLNLAVVGGRAALGSSLGGYPSVYSLGQFSIDVAEFGAASASASPHVDLPTAVARSMPQVVPCPPPNIATPIGCVLAGTIYSEGLCTDTLFDT